MKPTKGFVIPLLLLVIVMLISVGAYVYLQSKLPIVSDESVSPVACTADAKQCSDGSYVGRTGPNCEFVCPEVATNTGTSTSTSTYPVINSIKPNFGPIGTVIELRGTDLTGFEGDLDAVIENSKGETAVMAGMNSFTVDKNLIKVKIESKICKTNNSYSGLPCESYLSIAPGIYNIYAFPWGKESNKVQFTVSSNK